MINDAVNAIEPRDSVTQSSLKASASLLNEAFNADFKITKCKPANPDKPYPCPFPGGDKPGKPDKPELPGKPDKPDKPELPGKPDKPELPGKPDKPGKPGKPEKPGPCSATDNGLIMKGNQDGELRSKCDLRPPNSVEPTPGGRIPDQYSDLPRVSPDEKIPGELVPPAFRQEGTEGGEQLNDRSRIQQGDSTDEQLRGPNSIEAVPGGRIPDDWRDFVIVGPDSKIQKR